MEPRKYTQAKPHTPRNGNAIHHGPKVSQKSFLMKAALTSGLKGDELHPGLCRVVELVGSRCGLVVQRVSV